MKHTKCTCALTIFLVDFAHAGGVQNAIVGGSGNSAAVTHRYSSRAGLRRGDVWPNLLRVSSTQTLRGLNNSFISTSATTTSHADPFYDRESCFKIASLPHLNAFNVTIRVLYLVIGRS